MPLDVPPALLRRRRTKIVATIGPASREEAVLTRLVETGVDVFRVNMAHGEHDEHRAMIETVRRVAAARHLPIAVLADLAGPKIRVGRLAGGSVELHEGREVTVTAREVEGRPDLVPVGYPELARDLAAGHRLLLDDGRLELAVLAIEGDELRARVVHGGRLSARKGVNFPDSELSVSAPTEGDLQDADFAVESGVDFLGMSFVRRAADLHALAEHLGQRREQVRVVAKIEKPEALRGIDGILDASDAIMVARGDLGVEMPLESVPALQDELVLRARAAQRPVIIATQMLDSMIREPRPSRAEVSDVAHAVGSGTDAVMLSGETAVGAHPVETVRVMDRIVRRTEASLWERSAFGGLGLESDRSECDDVHEAVSSAVAQLSRDLCVRAVLVVSRSGTTGMVVSSCRPAAPLIAVTADEATRRAMNLFWGVVPFRVAPAEMDEPVPLCKRLVAELELGREGERGLIVRGFRGERQEDLPSITVVTF